MKKSIVKGGNNLVDGEINEENLKKTLKKISKRAFGNRPQQVLLFLVNF